MARSKSKVKSTAPNPLDVFWRALTWDDLQAWCGARTLERGRSYQRSSRVRDLARMPSGKLLAWVRGNERYATCVGPDDVEGQSAPLVGHCSCPVGFNCKHAVAVAVEYLEALKQDRPVPLAATDDPRWSLLERLEDGAGLDIDGADAAADAAVENDDEDDDGEEFTEVDLESTRAVRHERQSPRSPQPRVRKSARNKVDLRGWLEGLPASELVRFLLDFAQRHSVIAADLNDRAALAQGQTGELVREARKEITQLTRQPAWRNHWSGEGESPDYSRLETRFEQLLQAGEADALLDLGEQLFEAGQEQIGASHDEGETAEQINRCLDVVFRAVLVSSRPDHEKLLYVIDLLLRCDYDLGAGIDAVLEKDWPRAVWSRVADAIQERLEEQETPREDEYGSRYRRNGLTHWLIDSLEHAGRTEEILPLCEREAPLTGSYERLVQRLLTAGRTEDAERWAREGIEKTGIRWPGIAKQLQDVLRKLAEQRGDWTAVASYHAEEFFYHPSLHSLAQLQQAANQAGCGPEVRAAALHFLETGIRPRSAPSAQKSAGKGSAGGQRATAKSGPPWPLPPVSAAIPEAKREFPAPPARPHHELLLDLAIQEDRPDDVLRWYDRMRKERGNFGWGLPYSTSTRIADAVAATHPQRALDIYRQDIEGHIAQTTPSAYEAALPSLRKLRALLKQQERAAEFAAYVAKLREEHHRKRKLLETLDRLDAKPIVES
ncbi:MAG: SWIM zinc finger domain-containing protein [Planctomycetia bacterium]|nr:SWIM zinc finger domain-containing protein [Planctomycetia bacterium]